MATLISRFRLAGESWTLVSTFEGDDTIPAEPFEAVGLDMSRLWIPLNE
ncbi:MAG TPA: hypothetical protein VLK65_13860 [Vicinamibacteria bacterium]|nr:hypothetical protein [Vicinamibacteria bacterium]